MTFDDRRSCGCGTCPTCSGRSARRAVADPRTYRHGAIKRRMLATIGSTEIEGRRPLDALGTRDDDDPTIALIDAFAGALHVLAWNAGRLSDDGSIRRTEDRDAIVDLARQLGYEPRPAMSATTTLAVTVDAFPGSPTEATVPKGMKVASVPANAESPQIFETDEDLVAKVAWNALLPVQEPDVPPIDTTTTSIVIDGTSSPAKPGDLVLVYLEPQVAPPAWLFARVKAVERIANPEAPPGPKDPTATPPPARTRIDLVSATTLAAPASLQPSSYRNTVVVLGTRAAAFGATAPDVSLMTEEARASLVSSKFLDEVQVIREGGIKERMFQLPAHDDLPTEWPDLRMKPADNSGLVDLDAIYQEAVGDRLVVFTSSNGGPGPTQLGRITSVTELARKDYGLAAKVTRIGVDGIDLTSAGFRDKVRQTAIYLETSRERLFVPDAERPMPASTTDRLTVRGSVDLPIGRRIVLSGEAWTTPIGSGDIVGETVILKTSAATADGNTELVFERPIEATFRSTTLKLFANAVRASHGETPASGAEVLGSSSTATLAPRYQLRRQPLTYLAEPSDPRGYRPQVEVSVGDREYAEHRTLFDLGTADRAYSVRTMRGGTSEVQFAGRLPSGSFNVAALYRTGGGSAGNLGAGRITTVMTPILGIGSVRNPVPAEGASDPETIDDLRTGAPQSIRTLDRVVSLEDFEAFARTRPGVGKVLATELHLGMRSLVCLTIATTTLTSPGAGSDVVDALQKSLARVTVPGRLVRIAGFTDLAATVVIGLVSDPALRRPAVELAVRTRLGEAFGRATRDFGVGLARSALLAAIQGVEGVVAARVAALSVPNGPAMVGGLLPCPVPTIVDGVLIPAGLLSIDPSDVTFVEMPA